MLEVNQQNLRPFFLMSYKILKKYFCPLTTLIYVKIKTFDMMCIKQWMTLPKLKNCIKNIHNYKGQ